MNLLPFMTQWQMLPPDGGRILCAVSGGRDSVCLLHFLWTLGKRENFTVAAVHMDHGQRDTAGRDVAFVESLCRELDVPCIVEHTDVPGKAAEWGIGIEEAGRRLRYETFARAAEKLGADKIATAHHAADQAETVLLNLLRGSGMEGLAGIPPVRGKIIRPLLQTPREEIEAYCRINHLSFVEDETNTDTALTRNRLRLEIMPLLKGLYPGAQQSICRTAELLRREDTYLSNVAQAFLPSEGTAIDLRVYQAQPQALRLRMLRLLTERLPVGRKNFGAVHFEALDHLAQKGSGMLDLPYGTRAVCRKGMLRLQNETGNRPARQKLQFGRNDWGEYTITCALLKKKSLFSGNEILLNRGKIKETIWVAPCPMGERLRLSGSRGKRSIKRLCMDRGIDPLQRDSLPAIYVGEIPAAVWPLGVDEEFLPRSTEGEIIEIIIERRNSGGNSNG